MTDDEFLRYFSGGLDIQGHRVTARMGKLAPHAAVEAALPQNVPQFIIQVDHGQEIPVMFEPGEVFHMRMAKIDRAVERWVILHP